tara:strand:- start:304 stop:999 length:696 start_codon:yes stop_codon:yes gene_type:complete
MNLKLSRPEFNSGQIKMPNNLELMIRKSGMIKKEVAERMGVRPETVSRHATGALQFSVAQATEYAMILGCLAQDILFAQNAVAMFGTLDDSYVTICDPSEGEISYYVPFPVTENRRFIISEHTDQAKKWANGRMYMFENNCILSQKVDDTSFMRLCILKIVNEKKIRLGVVYPEPGGTFSVGVNVDSHTSTTGANSLLHTQVQNGLKLSWSTPILSCMMQPELLGVVRKSH